MTASVASAIATSLGFVASALLGVALARAVALDDTQKHTGVTIHAGLLRLV